jgi:hypothetical protein
VSERRKTNSEVSVTADALYGLLILIAMLFSTIPILLLQCMIENESISHFAEEVAYLLRIVHGVFLKIERSAQKLRTSRGGLSGVGLFVRR